MLVADKPNPGSSAAIAAGCTCAIYDNNHGAYPPRPPDGWWITEGCPLHSGDPSQTIKCPGCELMLPEDDLAAQVSHMANRHPDLVAKRQEQSGKWYGWEE